MRLVRPRVAGQNPEAAPQSDGSEPRTGAPRSWSKGVEAAAAAAAAAWPRIGAEAREPPKSSAPLRRAPSRRSPANTAPSRRAFSARFSAGGADARAYAYQPTTPSPSSVYGNASMGPRPPAQTARHPASVDNMRSDGSQPAMIPPGGGDVALQERTCSRRYYQLQSSLEACMRQIQDVGSVRRAEGPLPLLATGPDTSALPPRAPPLTCGSAWRSWRAPWFGPATNSRPASSSWRGESRQWRNRPEPAATKSYEGYAFRRTSIRPLPSPTPALSAPAAGGTRVEVRGAGAHRAHPPPPRPATASMRAGCMSQSRAG